MNAATWLLVSSVIFTTVLQISKAFKIEEKYKEIAALQAEIDMLRKACEHGCILKAHKIGE